MDVPKKWSHPVDDLHNDSEKSLIEALEVLLRGYEFELSLENRDNPCNDSFFEGCKTSTEAIIKAIKAEDYSLMAF